METPKSKSNQIWLPHKLRVCSTQKPVGPSVHTVHMESTKNARESAAGSIQMPRYVALLRVMVKIRNPIKAKPATAGSTVVIGIAQQESMGRPPLFVGNAIPAITLQVIVSASLCKSIAVWMYSGAPCPQPHSTLGATSGSVSFIHGSHNPHGIKNN